MGLHVVYSELGRLGYSPVDHMVRLATELFDAELGLAGYGRPGLFERIKGMALSRARRGTTDLLIVSPSPVELELLLKLHDWRSSYHRVLAWVFDSFWVDATPRFARMQRHFDHIFVTETEDLSSWRALVGREVSWLPWGADVLRMGSDTGARDLDLLRFGRQPDSWSDDEHTARRCAEAGLSFHGRPPSSDDPSENERGLAHLCARTKFTLSFSNRVSPSMQTHPYREYITSRWTIAPGCGATVAGVPPRTEALETLLWPEALLRFEEPDFESGLELVAEAARAWTPERAVRNHQMALERLDWRWRFKEIADLLGIRPPKLMAELAEIEARTGAGMGGEAGLTANAS